MDSWFAHTAEAAVPQADTGHAARGQCRQPACNKSMQQKWTHGLFHTAEAALPQADTGHAARGQCCQPACNEKYNQKNAAEIDSWFVHSKSNEQQM